MSYFLQLYGLIAHQAPLSMGFSRQEYWRVGCHALLQGIFPTQESILGLLHWQVDSLPSEPPGMPLVKNSGVVVMPSSKGSSLPRDQTHISLCLLHWQAGLFFFFFKH